MSVPPEPATIAEPFAERRLAADRRQVSLRALFCSLYRARRRAPRRTDGYDAGQYVDVIEPRIAVTTTAIMLLSCTDCANTLLLLHIGASELNPIMNALIEVDTTLFVATKLTMTAGCLLFIVAHNHFRFLGLRGGDVLYGILAMYLGLVAYQFVLLST